MVTLTVVSSLVGAALGLRFTVFLLLLAVSFAMTGVAVDGFVRGDTLWQLVAEETVVAISLQLGYLGGSAIAAAQNAIVAFLHSGPTVSPAGAKAQGEHYTSASLESGRPRPALPLAPGWLETKKAA